MYRKTLTSVFFPGGKATQFVAWKGDVYLHFLLYGTSIIEKIFMGLSDCQSQVFINGEGAY